MIVGVVPARMGSKGVPDKNIKELGGAPLVYWTIKAAVDSELSRVYVTTESKEVSSAVWPLLTEEERGKVYFLNRPHELSQDHVQVDEVVLFALRQMQLTGLTPEAIAILQPTSPFRKTSDINRAIITYRYLNDGTSVVSVCKAHDYHWKGSVKHGLIAMGHNPLQRKGRQQEGDKLYKENGAIYIVDSRKLEEYKTFRAPPFAPVYMDTSLEIDTEADWKRAQEEWSE